MFSGDTFLLMKLLDFTSPSAVSYQVLTVIIPEDGDSSGAGSPQQTQSEAAVDVHPHLLLSKRPLLSNTAVLKQCNKNTSGNQQDKTNADLWVTG